MNMKKLSLIICLVLAVSVIFTGCSATSSPENAVKNYCAGVKALNREKMNKSLREKSTRDLIEADADSDLGKFFKEQAGKMQYEITNSVVEEDKATITVEMTYIDVSDEMKSATADIVATYLASIFKGDDAKTQEDVNRIILEAVKGKELKTTTSTITFKCIKLDNEWLIDNEPYEIINVTSCNTLGILSSLK